MCSVEATSEHRGAAETRRPLRLEELHSESKQSLTLMLTSTKSAPLLLPGGRRRRRLGLRGSRKRPVSHPGCGAQRPRRRCRAEGRHRGKSSVRTSTGQLWDCRFVGSVGRWEELPAARTVWQKLKRIM